MNNTVTFDITPCDKKGKKARVKVYQDGKLIEVDTITIESRKSRASFIKSVAEKTGLDKDQLDELFIEQIESIQALSHDQTKDKQIDPLANYSAEVKQQAMTMLTSPDLFEEIKADIEKVGVAGEPELCRQLYIIMTSRILSKPLSGIIFGASASGKSYMIETVVKLMPKESVMQAHDITDQSLYYLEPGSLKNKIVIAGERIEDKRGRKGKAEDNTKALREVLASGKLSKMVTTKNSEGQLVSQIIEQDGPIAYLESTTSTEIHDEDATRLLPLVTDESAAQTEIIINAIRLKAMGHDDTKHRDQIISKHRAAQLMLRAARVIVPYADLLRLPCEVVATRRAFEQLLSMIKSVALLRQYQKTPLDNNPLIIQADTTDYAIVYPLIMRILARTYSPVNEKSLDLLKLILSKTQESFTVNEVSGWAGISDASIRRRLWELISRGIISINKESRPHLYKVESADLAEFADIDLISPEEIEERLAIMEF